MSNLKNKIDFVAIITVENANPNGDPLNGNRPRTDYNGFGEISDVCIKRKIRNRMMDMSSENESFVFVQSNERKLDEYKSLKERAEAEIKDRADIEKEKPKDKIKTDEDKYAEITCAKWIDVRSFGQVFAFKGSTDKEPVSVGVRGPISIHLARSISPVEINSMQITKSVNSEPGDKKGSDTMGTKHTVRFGVYKIKGSINVQLAEKTGFSLDDSNIVKECLQTLFENDASAGRPEGSMQVYKLYWWEHNSSFGQYSTAKVHNSLKITLKENIDIVTSIDDYTIELEKLDGLEPEVLDGI